MYWLKTLDDKQFAIAQLVIVGVSLLCGIGLGYGIWG